MSKERFVEVLAQVKTVRLWCACDGRVAASHVPYVAKLSFSGVGWPSICVVVPGFRECLFNPWQFGHFGAGETSASFRN